MSTTTSMRESRLLVAGEWSDAANGATFDVRDPYTGDVVVRAAAGSGADAERAVAGTAGGTPAGIPAGG